MKNILILMLLLSSFNVNAQKRYEKKGDILMSNSHYEDALDYYLKDKRRGDDVNKKIAKTYFKLGKYNLAERYMQRIKLKNYTVTDDLFLFDLNVNRQDFITANEYIQRAKNKSCDANVINNKINILKLAKQNYASDKSVSLKETILNMPGKGLGICLFSDELIYSRLVGMSSKSNAKPVYQLFKTLFKTSEINRGRALSSKLDAKYSVGAACFNGTSDVMFYTRWDIKRDGSQVKQIVQANKKNNKWESVKDLNFCPKRFSVAYPCLSNNDNTLYFSSNMPGGFGGMDIYKSEFKNGDWSAAENLGPTINSKGNEVYPFVSKDKILFFSSDGHLGLGGLDVFSSWLKSGIWSKPRNMSRPINSTYNDYSYTTTKSGDYSFFVTDRKEKGRKDRVYHIFKQVTDTIKIYVRDSKTNKPISNAMVDVLRIDTSEPVVCLASDDDSCFEFEENTEDVNNKVEYLVNVFCDGYYAKRINFMLSRNRVSLSVSLKIKPKPKVKEIIPEIIPTLEKPDTLYAEILKPRLVLGDKLHYENIIFDNNSMSFNDKSKHVLDELASMLNKYPLVKLKLNSHAKSYNSSSDVKSKRQAIVLMDFLLGKGISPLRISYKYWGDKFLLDNEGGPSNNRVELIVIY